MRILYTLGLIVIAPHGLAAQPARAGSEVILRNFRFADGESRELFTFTSGSFRSSRFAGGRSFVGGIYAEAASHLEDLHQPVSA